MSPLYDFRCAKCGRKFEAIANYKTVMAECECGAMADKIMSAPHFKMDGKLQTLGDNPENRKIPKSSTPEGVQQAKAARQKHIQRGDVNEWAGENKKRLKHGSDIDMD